MSSIALTQAPNRALPPAWQVRPMRLTDLPQVALIESRIFVAPWTPGNFADSLAAGYDGWVFTAADNPEHLLGYSVLMWLPDEVHLLNLSVDAPVQGCGMGRQMLEWLIRDVIRRGAPAMMLEVRPSNVAGLRLYDRLGFRRIGLRRGYYPPHEGVREDAIVMRRCLQAAAEPAHG
jgi:ribosomal-protein-alanine acetyltransferase